MKNQMIGSSIFRTTTSFSYTSLVSSQLVDVDLDDADLHISITATQVRAREAQKPNSSSPICVVKKIRLNVECDKR